MTAPASKHVDADACRTGLREAWTRRDLAERLRAEATLDLAAWVRAARAEGVSVTEIARLAGVSRQTVYALTKEEEQ